MRLPRCCGWPAGLRLGVRCVIWHKLGKQSLALAPTCNSKESTMVGMSHQDLGSSASDHVLCSRRI
jgi:hypothetical protein